MNIDGRPSAGETPEGAEDELVRVLDAYLADLDAGRSPDPPAAQCSDSITTEMPWPPPMHSVTTP